MTTETAIEVYEGDFALLSAGGDEFKEMLEENLGGEAKFSLSDLQRVSFPSAGGDEWVMETPTGRERFKSIQGVVLGQAVRRAFYVRAFEPGSDEPPDCSSSDGETGTPQTDAEGQLLNEFEGKVFGGDCSTCPLDEWGSIRLLGKNGDGKACREYRELLVQVPDRLFPVIVRIPPSALTTWRQFGYALTNQNLRLSTAVIELGLFLPPKATTATLQVRLVAKLDPGVSVLLKDLMPDMKRAPQLAAPAEPVEEEVAPF